MYSEATGLFAVAVGAYALARPASVRSYPTGGEWEDDPDRARREQRAYAAMLGFAAIVGGLVLIVLGLLGRTP